MGASSSIEWTDATWNPIRAKGPGGKIGWHCEHVSDGCRNCYAESMNRRVGTGEWFKPGSIGALGTVDVFLDEKILRAPLEWRSPRRIFVNSMTDTFARFVNDEWIDKMFNIMALCPHHTFQILTKRPHRMRQLVPFSPFPNVELGVSAEDQITADERIPVLLETQAAVRFVSLEPLIGPIVLMKDHEEGFTIDWLRGASADPPIPRLDWVIVGGESGPRARPMHPDWVRSIRDHCAAANVPFFFKQWGEWMPKPTQDTPSGFIMRRAGKRAAGRLLDGVLHDAMPAPGPG